ncbi:CAMK family protein kinase [Tritrichomonas foetus]|uniref:CAMK family protein kinase n=1 Tax=Tritrichomonas foetus TaxID=1144522 RepID=A0A1J4K753_9EUKA|nr:CAMK family protein kinase [Tritrichomonas foetus]|eukprot:OHT05532.1 CAMK family protein kinase [Tritrichomonas foetus]
MFVEIPLIPTSIGPYQFRAVLGEGATSVVKLAFHTKSMQYFACKVVSKLHLSTRNRLEKFQTEIKVMRSIHHPHIVQLIELLEDENFYYAIMEFCARGELFEYIATNKKLSETESKLKMKQILEAVSYIHSLGIAHRDLKPENLLLDTCYHIKLSDFGFSRYVETNNLVRTPCGSPCYASPECLSGQPYDPMKSDIWSCGVILYVMVTGQLPWTQRNSAQLFKQIQEGDYKTPSFLSDQCRDLITKMMCVDFNKRISIEEAFNHPWINNLRSGLVGQQYGRKISTAGAASMRDIDQIFQEKTSSPLLADSTQYSQNVSPIVNQNNENADQNADKSPDVTHTPTLKKSHLSNQMVKLMKESESTCTLPTLNKISENDKNNMKKKKKVMKITQGSRLTFNPHANRRNLVRYSFH